MESLKTKIDDISWQRKQFQQRAQVEVRKF